MSKDNKVVEMEGKVKEGTIESTKVKGKSVNSDDELKVTVDNEFITVSDGANYVKGYRQLTIGEHEYVKNKQNKFKNVRVRGDKDFTLTPKEEYKDNDNSNYDIWASLLVEWSLDQDINKTNIKNQRKLSPVLYKFLEIAKEENGLAKTKDDEEKN